MILTFETCLVLKQGLTRVPMLKGERGRNYVNIVKKI